MNAIRTEPGSILWGFQTRNFSEFARPSKGEPLISTGYRPSGVVIHRHKASGTRRGTRERRGTHRRWWHRDEGSWFWHRKGGFVGNGGKKPKKKPVQQKSVSCAPNQKGFNFESAWIFGDNSPQGLWVWHRLESNMSIQSILWIAWSLPRLSEVS